MAHCIMCPWLLHVAALQSFRNNRTKRNHTYAQLCMEQVAFTVHAGFAHAAATGSGGVAARPGVVRLMDEARAAGVPVAVCSAATKAAVQFVLENLLGRERFAGLDLFMAGDDVKAKKPDPTIYKCVQKIGEGWLLHPGGYALLACALCSISSGLTGRPPRYGGWHRRGWCATADLLVLQTSISTFVVHPSSQYIKCVWPSASAGWQRSG
jgi:hypothetical protein